MPFHLCNIISLLTKKSLQGEQSQRSSSLLWFSSPASCFLLVYKVFGTSAHNAENLGSIPGSGRSSGGGTGNPLQYSCLENSMNRGALVGYSQWDRRVGQDWMTNTHVSRMEPGPTALKINKRCFPPLSCSQSARKNNIGNSKLCYTIECVVFLT